MSTYNKINASYQELQCIISVLSSSVPSNIFNISAGLTVFTNNESIKK